MDKVLHLSFCRVARRKGGGLGRLTGERRGISVVKSAKKTPKSKSPVSTARKRSASVSKPTKNAKSRRSLPPIKKAKVLARSGNGSPKKSNRMEVAPPVVMAKPAKNQAGLKTKDLEFFRDLLLAKRRELLGDVHSMEEEALRHAADSNLSNLPIHMADMGTDNYEQEFTLGLVEKDRQLLREINTALTKIRDGRYGICEGTGKPISKARLEAKPWARYSIEYTRQMESGMIRPS